MDSIISKKTLYEHFNIINIYQSLFSNEINGLGENFSARQLCEVIIERFWNLEDIPIDGNRNHDDNVAKSGLFAVACEFTGKLHDKDAKIYTNERGGPLFFVLNKEEPHPFNIDILSLREVIEWMCSQ